MDFSIISDQELYRRCQEYGRNARLWMRQFAALLPEVMRRELFRKYKFGSIFEFARVIAGMSQEAVSEVLRVSRKLEDKPLLKQLVPLEGVAKLRLVANVATKDTESFWAEKVTNLSRGSLQIFVQQFSSSQTNLASSRTGTERIHHSFDLTPETDARLQKFKKKLENDSGAVDFETIIKKLLDIADPKEDFDLEKEKERAEKVSECAEGRYIPEAVKKYVTHRHNGMCAFPNCRKTFDEFHHTRRFSLNKSHDPNFIVPLCSAHHHFAHTGLIENEESDVAQWRVRMEPDKNSPKYFVDRKAGEFIRGG